MDRSQTCQWAPDTLQNMQPYTFVREVSSELDEIDSFPTPMPRPQNLPLRILSLGPALLKLDALYNPEDHMNTRDEYSTHNAKSKEGVVAFEEHNKTRMAYVQLASQRLQAATGMSNANTFDLPSDTTKRVIVPPSLLDGYKPIPITPLTTHNIPPVSSLKGGPAQEATDGTTRVLCKKDSGISLSGQTTPVPVGIETIDRETGKGLREFMLAKGKEHGMRKREAKEISFWDFKTDLKTCERQEEEFVGYDVAEPGDRIDLYEIDLPTKSHDLATGSEVRGKQTWLWILIQRKNVVVIDPHNLNNVPDEHEFSNEKDDTPAPIFPPNFPCPPPAPWVVIAAPLAQLTIYPETIETPPPSAERPAARFFKSQRSKCKSNGGHKVHKQIDYDFSHSGIPLFELSMQSCSDITLNPSSVPFLSVEDIGTWYENDSYEKMSGEEWEADQASLQEYIKTCAVEDPVKYNMIFDPRLDGTAVENQGFGIASPFKGVWWMQFYNGIYTDACLWRNIKKAMARGECRVVVRWSEWEEAQNKDAEFHNVIGDTLNVDEMLARARQPMNPIGTGRNARERCKTTSGRRRPSKLSVDDGTLPVTENCFDTGENIGVGLGISFGIGAMERRSRSVNYLGCEA